jgi:hypothetical protein
MELEGQRKTIDWWFSFLAVLTAIMAIFGALIPFLMARKDKEIIEQDKAQIRKLLDEVKGMKDDAEGSVKEIHRHEAEAKAAKETVLSFQSATASSTKKEVREAVDQIEQDKTADPLLRLRAEAVAASKPELANKAYRLWAALAELSNNDANAYLNAGYWAGMISRKFQGNEKQHWLGLIKYYCEKALHIEPNAYWAASNWGYALNEEAIALSSTDLPEARALWRIAREKCQLALNIKRDSHEAANNLGYGLLSEARAIAANEPEQSKNLLNQAELLLLQHAEAAPGIVAYNIACIYSLQQDVLACLKWLRIAQQHNSLESCEHMREDHDLDTIRNTPEFIEWFKQVCP